MIIYITRHSLTQWNEEKRLQGWKDSPLTKQGILDAKKLGAYIENLPIDAIYSSPIGRALETSKTIFPHRNTITDPRIMELNFGDFEGLKISDLSDNALYHKLWHEPEGEFSLPHGETYNQVLARLKSFLDEAYTKHSNETIFMTIHGMLFTILHGYMLNYPVERFNEVNREIVRGCSLTKVFYDGKTFTIEYMGEDSFLEPLKEKIIYK